MDDQKGRGAPGGDQALSAQAARDVDVVAKGGAVQVVGQVTQRGLAFVYAAVLFRFLGKSGAGRYRLVFQVLSNMSQLGLAGFNYAAMRFMTLGRASKQPSRVKGAMQVALAGTIVASLISTVILLVWADPIAGLFDDDPQKRAELVELIRIGSPYILLYALMQVLRYCTQSYKTMVPSVMVGNVIQPALRFVIGVGVLIAGAGVAGALVSLNISVAIAVVVAAWYLAKMLTEAERMAIPEREVGPMVRFALPQAGSSLLGVQTLGLGVLLLGVYKSDAAVGLFTVALQLQGPGNVFLGGIVNIWAPVVSDLHAKGEIARLVPGVRCTDHRARPLRSAFRRI
jgi:O-antigen/teichoic acid export membrane protein